MPVTCAATGRRAGTDGRSGKKRRRERCPRKSSPSQPVPKACLFRKPFGNSEVLTVCGVNILGNLQPRREAMKFDRERREAF